MADRRKIRNFVRLRKEREIALYKAFKKFYSKQGRKVVEQYEMNGVDGAISAINNTSLDLDVIFRKFYSDTIGTLASAQIKSVLRRTKAEQLPHPDRFIMLSQEWINKNVATQVTMITQTDMKLIRNIIDSAVLEGLGERQIAKNIKKSFSGEISSARARTIARTETGNAASYAQDLGAKESGIEYRKEWVPVDDGATRQGHLGIEPVGKDELFLVNGELMEHPNDPNGSAGNVINCRCVCIYEPIL